MVMGGLVAGCYNGRLLRWLVVIVTGLYTGRLLSSQVVTVASRYSDSFIIVAGSHGDSLFKIIGCCVEGLS